MTEMAKKLRLRVVPDVFYIMTTEKTQPGEWPDDPKRSKHLYDMDAAFQRIADFKASQFPPDEAWLSPAVAYHLVDVPEDSEDTGEATS